MPKVLVLKAQGRHVMIIFGVCGAFFWPKKIASHDGWFLLNIGGQAVLFWLTTFSQSMLYWAPGPAMLKTATQYLVSAGKFPKSFETSQIEQR